MVLNKIQCVRFCNINPWKLPITTFLFSGAIWNTYTACRKEAGSTVRTCLDRLQTVCRASKHRVTKVVRLTVDNLETVLSQVPNLKVIHLLRDPRAIINSRITTTWYTLKDAQEGEGEQLSKEAEDLCRRMTYDLDESVKLKQKFPDRFSLVSFEDLNTNLQLKSYILYNYLGINNTFLSNKLSTMPAILKEEHNVVSETGDFINWWRYNLSFQSIHLVQNVCAKLLLRLGYEMFHTQADLLNSTLHSFKSPDVLLLENMAETSTYTYL